MNIKDLPEELRELALLRKKEDGKYGKGRSGAEYCIIDMFCWSSTPDAKIGTGSFWFRVDSGIYTKEDLAYARNILNKECTFLITN